MNLLYGRVNLHHIFVTKRLKVLLYLTGVQSKNPVDMKVIAHVYNLYLNFFLNISESKKILTQELNVLTT